MKIVTFLLGLLTGFFLQAQDPDITGEWTLFEMTWTSGSDENKTTEDQLNDQGMKSEYFFMPEGKLKLVSNMTGSGVEENIEGTWKLEGDKLTCGFMRGEHTADIVWDFEFKDEEIHLKRTSPDGSTSVLNCFKRK